jgi:hypothetical protein
MDLLTAPAALRSVTPLLIILVVASSAWFIGRTRRVRFLKEAALILGAYFAYFGVRAISEGSASIALENARLLIELEQKVGLFVEPSVQGLLLSSEALMGVANWIYVWGHWPVIGIVAIWLFARKPGAYRRYRNALLISGGIGLIFFIGFPAAPPRFTDLGLVDTVFSQSVVANLMQPTSFTNQYAAFPSLHFGWSLLMATAIFRESKRQHVRVVAWLLPLGMLVSIVATANHFVVDALAGGIISLVGLRAALALEQGDASRWLQAVVRPVRARWGDEPNVTVEDDDVEALDISA